MSSKKLICRHCKGDHLSLQCPTKRKNKSPIKLNFSNKKTKNYTREKKLLVKMHPLPTDVYKKELVDLLQEWGPIGKIYLKKNRETRLLSATIEFMKRSQGLKAIYQLHETNFDYLKINVEELTTKNYS